MHYYCKTASTLSNRKNSTDKDMADLHVPARSKESKRKILFIFQAFDFFFEP